MARAFFFCIPSPLSPHPSPLLLPLATTQVRRQDPEQMLFPIQRRGPHG
jgi:hypothetical protein